MNNSNGAINRLNKLVIELRELLKYSRDVELRQVLERLESTMSTLMKGGHASETLEGSHQEPRNISGDVRRENVLTEEIPSDEPASLRSLTNELHFERENRASLRHHLDEFQALLDRVRAENHQLSLSLSEVETERLRERHMWLVSEAELKSNNSVLDARVRCLEEDNERLRAEVADSHCRAAAVVRDTHAFLASVRQGLLRFVRELRADPQAQGCSPRPRKQNASLREMIRLVKDGARSIDASSDAWIAHLSESPTKLPAKPEKPEQPEEERDEPGCKTQDDTMLTGQLGLNNTIQDHVETCNTSDILSTSRSSVTISLDDSITISQHSFRRHLKALDHKLANLQHFIHKSS